MNRLLPLLLCVAFATGCANVRSMLPGGAPSATAGGEMLSQARETKQLGKSWQEGQRLVDKGNRLMARSQKLEQESRDAKTTAQGMIAQGNALIQESESTFQTAFKPNGAGTELK